MILLISATFPPEPVVAASLVKDLAETLTKDQRVTVISPKPTRPLGFMFSEITSSGRKFEHIVLNSFTYPKSKILGRFRESYSFGKHSSKYIIMNRKEIQCCYISAWPLIGQYLIIKTLRKYSIPSVIHIQDIYPESVCIKLSFLGNLIRLIFMPMDKYILKYSSKVVAISKNMSNTFIKTRGVHEDKIELVQNWKNEEEFIKDDKSIGSDWAKRINGNPFIFMYLGNIGLVAGCDFLIRSFAKADIRDSLMIIAGCGSDKDKCIRLARSYNNVNIEFWDVPNGQVSAVQKISNVMLLPVKRGAAMSSVPSKLPSYMFSKKPVIACVDENSDTKEAVVEAKCGWIVPPENIDKLAAMMRYTASMNREDLTQLGENGYRYALTNYSAKINVQKLASVIIETINHG
jgi:glycosyltransferase involved in cell wall biosynthesis